MMNNNKRFTGGDEVGTDLPIVHKDETKSELKGEPTDRDIDGESPDADLNSGK